MGKRRPGGRDSRSGDCGAWEPEYSPVWHLRAGEIVPSAICLKWWSTLAERKYGDAQRWLDIACELGYVARDVHPELGTVVYHARIFDHDAELMRRSLCLSDEDPLVFEDRSSNLRQYQRLWDTLLKEKDDEERSDLG